MATKPELNIAVAYAKNKASEYNENFDRLLNYIEEVSEELNLKVNTINSQLSSTVLSNLQSVYPIGSLYIGINDTCPIANLFGTWEKVAEGLVVDINSNIAVKGNGKALGLRGDTDTYGLATSSSGDIGRILGVNTQARNANAGASISRQTSPRDFYAVGVTTNASQSGLVGTASATKLEVNIWKRTA